MEEKTYFVVVDMLNGNATHMDITVYAVEELFSVVKDIFGSKIKSIFYTETSNVVKKVY